MKKRRIKSLLSSRIKCFIWLQLFGGRWTSFTRKKPAIVSSRSQSTASHLFARTRSFHRPTLLGIYQTEGDAAWNVTGSNLLTKCFNAHAWRWTATRPKGRPRVLFTFRAPGGCFRESVKTRKGSSQRSEIWNRMPVASLSLLWIKFRKGSCRYFNLPNKKEIESWGKELQHRTARPHRTWKLGGRNFSLRKNSWCRNQGGQWK